MEYVVGVAVAALLVAWLIGFLFLVYLWADTGRWLWGFIAAALLIAGLGVVFGAIAKREAERPCVAYEMRNRYNFLLKVYMPMRVCVERGEWVVE